MNVHSCQEVCPWNQRLAQMAAERDYAAREAWEDEWDAYTRGSAMRRAGYAGLRRNVAIAPGNWLAGLDAPDAEAVGELVAALSDEDGVVAETAAWALGRARRGA